MLGGRRASAVAILGRVLGFFAALLAGTVAGVRITQEAGHVSYPGMESVSSPTGVWEERPFGESLLEDQSLLEDPSLREDPSLLEDELLEQGGSLLEEQAGGGQRPFGASLLEEQAGVGESLLKEQAGGGHWVEAEEEEHFEGESLLEEQAGGAGGHWVGEEEEEEHYLGESLLEEQAGDSLSEEQAGGGHWVEEEEEHYVLGERPGGALATGGATLGESLLEEHSLLEEQGGHWVEEGEEEHYLDALAVLGPSSADGESSSTNSFGPAAPTGDLPAPGIFFDQDRREEGTGLLQRRAFSDAAEEAADKTTNKASDEAADEASDEAWQAAADEAWQAVAGEASDEAADQAADENMFENEVSSEGNSKSTERISSRKLDKITRQKSSQKLGDRGGERVERQKLSQEIGVGDVSQKLSQEIGVGDVSQKLSQEIGVGDVFSQEIGVGDVFSQEIGVGDGSRKFSPEIGVGDVFLPVGVQTVLVMAVLMGFFLLTLAMLATVEYSGRAKDREDRERDRLQCSKEREHRGRGDRSSLLCRGTTGEDRAVREEERLHDSHRAAKEQVGARGRRGVSEEWEGKKKRDDELRGEVRDGRAPERFRRSEGGVVVDLRRRSEGGSDKSFFATMAALLCVFACASAVLLLARRRILVWQSFPFPAVLGMVQTLPMCLLSGLYLLRGGSGAENTRNYKHGEERQTRGGTKTHKHVAGQTRGGTEPLLDGEDQGRAHRGEEDQVVREARDFHHHDSGGGSPRAVNGPGGHQHRLPPASGTPGGDGDGSPPGDQETQPRPGTPRPASGQFRELEPPELSSPRGRGIGRPNSGRLNPQTPEEAHSRSSTSSSSTTEEFRNALTDRLLWLVAGLYIWSFVLLSTALMRLQPVQFVGLLACQLLIDSMVYALLTKFGLLKNYATAGVWRRSSLRGAVFFICCGFMGVAGVALVLTPADVGLAHDSWQVGSLACKLLEGTACGRPTFVLEYIS